MKKFILISTLLFSLPVLVSAQDVVYATSFSSAFGGTFNEKITKISVDPITGSAPGSFSDVENIPASAALGADANGWLYFLRYGNSGQGEGDGQVRIYATRANGVGSESQVATADLNGASGTELTFVRLGVDNTGTGWILAAETGSNPKLYLAKFLCNGNAATSVTVVSSNINVSDGSNSIFINGDIAFDGTGTMYALANDGQGSTKIYTIVPSSISGAGPHILNYKWTLKEKVGISNQNFAGRVNGCAFTSTGNMVLSTDIALYLIDQNSINFAGSGTVECLQIKLITGVTDLATATWPATTKLPVRFKSITAKVIAKNLVEVTFEVMEQLNISHYNIQVSADGRNFKTVMVVFPQTGKPEQKYVYRIKL